MHNFDGVFMDWAENIVTKLANDNERGSKSKVLFIEDLDVNVDKF